MNKKLIVLFSLVFTFGIAFAQITADPQDDGAQAEQKGRHDFRKKAAFH